MMKQKILMVMWIAASVTGFAAGTSAPPVQVEGAITSPAGNGKAGEVGTLLSSGRDCLVNGRPTEGLALFEKAFALDPANNEAAFGLSAALLELKRFSEARPVLEKLALNLPDHPMVKNNLAWAILEDKSQKSPDTARAIKLARAALMDVPSDYSIWNTLGEAYYAAGQFEKALRAAQSGLRLSLLAGITNSPCRELSARCRKAAASASTEKDGEPGRSRDPITPE